MVRRSLEFSVSSCFWMNLMMILQHSDPYSKTDFTLLVGLPDGLSVWKFSSGFWCPGFDIFHIFLGAKHKPKFCSLSMTIVTSSYKWNILGCALKHSQTTNKISSSSLACTRSFKIKSDSKSRSISSKTHHRTNLA